jgi:hypothetical protein
VSGRPPSSVGAVVRTDRSTADHTAVGARDGAFIDPVSRTELERKGEGDPRCREHILRWPRDVPGAGSLHQRLLRVAQGRSQPGARPANPERLVGFFDFLAEHWNHLRTTNVIELPFAIVRLRERATRAAGSRTKGYSLSYSTWPRCAGRLDGAHLLPLARRSEIRRWSPAGPSTESHSNK